MSTCGGERAVELLGLLSPELLGSRKDPSDALVLYERLLDELIRELCKVLEQWVLKERAAVSR